MADTSILKYDIRAMLRKFGVVTVMDVKAYETALFKKAQEEAEAKDAVGTEGTDGYEPATPAKAAYEAGEWDAISTLSKEPVFTLDTLKIANINQEGPTKSITGGQNADTLLKYGKTLNVEMQDALGHYDVLENVYGVNFSSNHQIATFTDRFPKELTLVGTTFVIDQATGSKQPIHIVIPRFLGDGIFNLQQDAEGDATVFDLNGNILKFEGGSIGSEPVDSGEERFKCTDGSHAENAEFDGKIYGPGADNEFYFMCTKDILPAIKELGYRECYEAYDIVNGEVVKKPETPAVNN